MAKARAKACKLSVWVGPARSTNGIALYRKTAGGKTVEALRFSKASVAKTFVRAMVKHEGACFVPTETMRTIKPRSRR